MTAKRIILLYIALRVFAASCFGFLSRGREKILVARTTEPVDDEFFFKNGSIAHLLEARADRTYEETVERGRLLNCLMSATEDEATRLNGGQSLESTFDEYDIIIGLDDEGWDNVGGNLRPKYESTGLRDTLMPLTGANYEKTIYTYLESARDFRGGTATGAYLAQGINGAGGVIIADNNLSPQNAPLYVAGIRISRLQRWSQAAFGQWEYEAGAREFNVKSLKYVIRSWVINPETLTKTSTALSNLGLSEYPNFNNKIVLSRDSTNPKEVDGFLAILGTPNGSSTAFLLASHKKKFGIKRVSSITVWNYLGPLPLGTSKYLKVMISFALEDVGDPTS